MMQSKSKDNIQKILILPEFERYINRLIFDLFDLKEVGSE
jgi:hypothetical protein